MPKRKLPHFVRRFDIKEDAQGVEVPDTVLHRMGRVLIHEIRREARRAFAIRGVSPDGKLTVQSSRRFYNSIDYELSGNGKIDVVSDWEWIKDLMAGKKIDQDSAARRIPLIDRTGKIIVRIGPLQTKDVWIHPSIAKYSFLEQGLKKGRAKMDAVLQSALPQLIADQAG